MSGYRIINYRYSGGGGGGEVDASNKIDKVKDACVGNIPSFTSGGNLKDSGIDASTLLSIKKDTIVIDLSKESAWDISQWAREQGSVQTRVSFNNDASTLGLEDLDENIRYIEIFDTILIKTSYSEDTNDFFVTFETLGTQSENMVISIQFFKTTKKVNLYSYSYAKTLYVDFGDPYGSYEEEDTEGGEWITPDPSNPKYKTKHYELITDAGLLFLNGNTRFINWGGSIYTLASIDIVGYESWVEFAIVPAASLASRVSFTIYIAEDESVDIYYEEKDYYNPL